MDDSRGCKPKKIADLNELYSAAESIDKAVFAEQRTNIRLVAGDHYNLTGSKYFNRIRNQGTKDDSPRLRLTMNHTGRIARAYLNSILSNNPNVTVSPMQPKELSHQKAAEMKDSVLAYLKDKHKFNRKKYLWAKDFVEIGEVFVKVFWDESAGEKVGWEQAVDGMTGEPAFDPMTGQPQQSNIPVMSGDVIFETVHGFDLLRDPGCKAMENSPHLIIRKMESVKDLIKKFGTDDEKKSFIKEGGEDTFRVFQSSSGTYSTLKGLTMVREYYFRECAEYPNGHWYIATDLGILAEGELPFGIFPIYSVGFDELTTSPRSKSIVKQLRPYQVELNRMASQRAETQITMGMDKLVIQSGSKTSTGATQPGIRIVTTAPGPAPTVIPGRSGDQFTEAYQQTIAEMYQIAEVPELDQEMNNQLDPYALLFRSIRQKQKFSVYGDKFENFLCDVMGGALELYRLCIDDKALIPIVGKNEMVNIKAFKAVPPNVTQVKIEPMNDDIETKMGKNLALNHILQFVGPQLNKNDIGKLIRLSPYLNNEKSFADMTNSWDNLANDILSLDRGEMPPMSNYEDHDYVIAGLTSRMKQPDFKYLPPQIQNIYGQKLQQHEGIKANQLAETQRAQSGFIPSGGYAVVCDLYVTPDPNKPETTKRLRVPSESLQWLIKQLQVQGSAQDQIEQLQSPQAGADIAQLLQARIGMGANNGVQ